MNWIDPICDLGTPSIYMAYTTCRMTKERQSEFRHIAAAPPASAVVTMVTRRLQACAHSTVFGSSRDSKRLEVTGSLRPQSEPRPPAVLPFFLGIFSLLSTPWSVVSMRTTKSISGASPYMQCGPSIRLSASALVGAHSHHPAHCPSVRTSHN